jgi:hypothetical protein
MTRHHKSERRHYYRVRYPPADQPTLTIGEEKYQITQLSERGLKFLRKEELDLGNEPGFRGTITFHDGEQENIQGVVIREEEAESVALVQGGISFRRMMKEQRYLRAKYRPK